MASPSEAQDPSAEPLRRWQEDGDPDAGVRGHERACDDDEPDETVNPSPSFVGPLSGGTFVLGAFTDLPPITFYCIALGFFNGTLHGHSHPLRYTIP